MVMGQWTSTKPLEGDDLLYGGKHNDFLDCGLGTDLGDDGQGSDTATGCETIRRVEMVLREPGFLNSGFDIIPEFLDDVFPLKNSLV